MGDITKIKVNGDPESSYQLYPRNEEFAKRAGGNAGSQSGVQSDWNQNDATKPDYVKNRPFYMGAPIETVIVEESTVAFSKSPEGFYAGEFPSFEAKVGDTYKVSWDSTVYECTCRTDMNGDIHIGDPYLLDGGSGTGEPFDIIVDHPNGALIVTEDTSASHTFSISRLVTEVVKIDEKYLPTPEYIIPSSTSGSTKKFKITVDDNGALTATEVT